MRDILGVPVKLVPAGGQLNYHALPQQTGLLFPGDDARGRRWLYAKGVQGPAGWRKKDTSVFLGFQQQKLVTVAWLYAVTPAGESDFPKLRRRLVEDLDRRYSRLHLPASNLAFWAGHEPGRAVVLGAAFDGLLLSFTTDRFELAASQETHRLRCRPGN